MITKEIYFSGAAASGATLDCNGALISATATGGRGDRDIIRIKPELILNGSGGRIWTRPQNVTIRNCRVEGSVRIYGAFESSSSTDALRSSWLEDGHTLRLQNASPRAIVLKNLTVNAHGRTALYFGTGITDSTLISSAIGGSTGAGPAIYLDAESGNNAIINNFIRVTSEREQVVVDGSAGNRIVGNTIRTSGRRGGGIYLYRNCGERGVSRHQPPQGNVIVHNNFGSGREPSVIGNAIAIFVGSRQGDRNYCHLDSRSRFGSGTDDRDFARRNVIAQNWYLPSGL